MGGHGFAGHGRNREMHSNRFKALRCTISRGGFSDERVFTLPSGYSGVASLSYVWHEDGRPLEEGEPPLGQTIDGQVAVRVIEIAENGGALVVLPDGQSAEVTLDELIDRPLRVGEHVSLGS
jgi:hypothetical protein